MNMHSRKPDSLPAGVKVGPFEIIAPLNASGGMATLYLAQVRASYRHSGIPDQVALKVAKAEYEDFLKTEAAYLMRLAGRPHIVKIFPVPGCSYTVYWNADTVRIDQTRSERLCFIAMEYVAGGSLRAWLNRRTPLSRLMAIGIARQIVEALSYAHEQHIIHLDLKPENILLRRRPLDRFRSSVPHVVLCDFGIARDLSSLARVEKAASPDYSSPEMLMESDPARKTVGYPADVYMVGEMLYEMLTGRVPFDDTSQKLARQMPLPITQLVPSSPRELESIVMRALAYEPGARYADAVELRQALARVSMGLDVGLMTRYLLAGVLAAGVVTAAIGLSNITPITPMSTPLPGTISITPTLTVTPSITPTIKVTSTRAPTRTPTMTPKPVVSTATISASASTPAPESR